DHATEVGRVDCDGVPFLLEEPGGGPPSCWRVCLQRVPEQDRMRSGPARARQRRRDAQRAVGFLQHLEPVSTPLDGPAPGLRRRMTPTAPETQAGQRRRFHARAPVIAIAPGAGAVSQSQQFSLCAASPVVHGPASFTSLDRAAGQSSTAGPGACADDALPGWSLLKLRTRRARGSMAPHFLRFWRGSAGWPAAELRTLR